MPKPSSFYVIMETYKCDKKMFPKISTYNSPASTTTVHENYRKNFVEKNCEQRNSIRILRKRSRNKTRNEKAVRMCYEDTKKTLIKL